MIESLTGKLSESRKQAGKLSRFRKCYNRFMKSEIVPIKTFKELVGGMSEEQAEYLALRVRGLQLKEALEIVNRSKWTLREWRRAGGFKEAEHTVLECGGIYKREVGFAYDRQIGKIELGLIKVALKVEKWDTLTDKQRGHVIKACGLLGKVLFKGEKEEGEKAGNYEELIHRIRRQVPEVAEGSD